MNDQVNDTGSSVAAEELRQFIERYEQLEAVFDLYCSALGM